MISGVRVTSSGWLLRASRVIETVVVLAIVVVRTVVAPVRIRVGPALTAIDRAVHARRGSRSRPVGPHDGAPWAMVATELRRGRAGSLGAEVTRQGARLPLIRCERVGWRGHLGGDRRVRSAS